MFKKITFILNYHHKYQITESAKYIIIEMLKKHNSIHLTDKNIKRKKCHAIAPV